MASRFSVEAIFSAVDRVTAPVRNMQRSVGQFTRRSQRGMERLHGRMNNFGAGVGSAMAKGAVGVGVMGAAFADIIGIGMEFEQSITNAFAKFPIKVGESEKALKSLNDAAKSTGATTEFSATEAANALDFLAMAGFSVENAVAALPGVVDLATASGLDLAAATDIASDSLGAFNLMSEDSAQLGLNLARVNDVMAATATSANTDMASMFESIKEGAPIATSAGASIETFSSMVGVLANSGIKGSKAGTTLKNMFVRLQAPVPKAAALIKKLGIETQNADGSMKDMINILGQVNDKTKKLTETEKNAALSKIFGMEALAGVNVLLNSGADKLNAYRTKLEGSTGAAGEMAKTMRGTVANGLKGLGSAIEGVKIQIFDMNSGGLSNTIELMTQWVRTNSELIAGKIGSFLSMIIENLDTIITVVKWVGGAFAVFFVVMSILKTFITVMTVVNLVMGLNPFGLMVLGVAALIAVLVALVAYFHDDLVAGLVSVAENVITAWQPVAEFFSMMFDKIMTVVNLASGLGGGVIDSVKGFFGFGSDGEDGKKGASNTQVVSPQARVARQVDEQRTTSTSEVTLRTDSNTRAEVTKGKLGGNLQIQSTGAF